MTKTEIFASLKNGLRIGKNGETVKWSTPLTELEKYCETFSQTDNLPTHIYFGQKEIIPGVTLGLYTPFDTYRNNNNQPNLFHVGQNLNETTVKTLVTTLTNMLGQADEQNETYGIFRKWKDQDTEICIFPRSHHGSDWNAITIEIKNCL